MADVFHSAWNCPYYFIETKTNPEPKFLKAKPFPHFAPYGSDFVCACALPFQHASAVWRRGKRRYHISMTFGL